MCDCICKNGGKCPQKPIDFSTAQVGDTLRTLVRGDEKLNEIDSTAPHMEVGCDWYHFDGKREDYHEYPTVIGWVHPVTGKLCRTRPEPVIDWEKVAVDAPVKINREVFHFAKMSEFSMPMFWSDGRTSYSAATQRCETMTGNPTYELIKTEEQ